MIPETLYPYKILFVEDEKATRENYVTYLKMLFKEVYEDEDGEQAYQIYKDEKPDIMIIDINIPKLNGLELLKRIRENDHTTKALMLTAHTDKAFLLEAISLKLTQYLVKTVSRKDLKNALNLTIKELTTYEISPLKKIDLSDNFCWDIEKMELSRFGAPIELTSNERKFLSLMFSKNNKTFTYDEIYDHFWEEDNFNSNSLKNMVKRLRKKLPEDTILNQFNEGYKINF